MNTTHSFATCSLIDSTTILVPGLKDTDVDYDNSIDLYITAAMNSNTQNFIVKTFISTGDEFSSNTYTDVTVGNYNAY